MTITGIGFYSGATVKFVAESGGVLGASVPASSTVNGPTSITAFAPPVGAAGTYYITVSTAGGTSAAGPIDVFTYSQLQANPG